MRPRNKSLAFSRCGEGACSRWAGPMLRAKQPYDFAVATQPNGSKLPRHGHLSSHANVPNGRLVSTLLIAAKRCREIPLLERQRSYTKLGKRCLVALERDGL